MLTVSRTQSRTAADSAPHVSSHEAQTSTMLARPTQPLPIQRCQLPLASTLRSLPQRRLAARDAATACTGINVRLDWYARSDASCSAVTFLRFAQPADAD